MNPTEENKNDKSIATAIFIIGSIIGTYFMSVPGKRRSRTKLFEEQQKEVDRNLTTPANATFGLVWPVIYAGTAGLAIHQALPSQSNNSRYKQAIPWLVTSYALNALFGFFFSSDTKNSRIGAAITTVATLPPALLIHQALEIGKTTVPEPENTLRKSISLYMGWLTAASVISIGNLMLQAGYQVSPDKAAKWTYGVLTFTGILGLNVAKKLNDPYYLLPLAAAFTGIALKQYRKQNKVSLLAGILATGMVLSFSQHLKPVSK